MGFNNVVPARGGDVIKLFLTRSSVCVSRTEVGVLRNLREGPRRITELAAEERVTQPAITLLVNRLEERGWIKGVWVEKPNERRRRFYKVTTQGRRVLAQQRKTWAAFVDAVQRVTGDEFA